LRHARRNVRALAIDGRLRHDAFFKSKPVCLRRSERAPRLADEQNRPCGVCRPPPGAKPLTVDVQTEIQIDRPRDEVAAYASDPDNATSWYENIKSVEWKSAKPLAVGSRVAFVAQFLGRRLAYTYEVKEFVPGERFVQSTTEGPFPMETTYTWQDNANGGTTMRLRNRGEPSGFSKIVAPMMAGAMRRANRKDLVRLKALLEAAPRSTT
jgi:uncharacterized membrane protein